MCDDDIHQGLVHDPALSRRTFGLMAAAAAAVASGARAQARVTETDVAVKTPDGEADAALFHPAGEGPWPAVLVWPDVLGLRPVFREMGRRLAAEGYVVLVVNPFYRAARAPIFGGAPFDFSKEEDRKKMAPLRATLTPENVAEDAVAYLAFLDAQPQTNKAAKAGVQGYCMGGALSVRTAAAVPERIGAVASFHGGGLASAEPASPHLLFPRTRAEYLVLVADNDDRKDPAEKDRVAKALKAAGRPAKVEVYAGADHGWTVKGSQVYNEPAAEKAWSELLAFYKRTLK